jgi:RNase P subunit RPR2
MRYVDVKVRREHAATLRELAMKMNVKIADVVALWPRCPKCGALLVQVEEAAVVCSNCRRGYALVERQ